MVQLAPQSMEIAWCRIGRPEGGEVPGDPESAGVWNGLFSLTYLVGQRPQPVASFFRILTGEPAPSFLTPTQAGLAFTHIARPEAPVPFQFASARMAAREFPARQRTPPNRLASWPVGSFPRRGNGRR